MDIGVFSAPQIARFCAGVPVYRYGYTDIYGAPPQLSDDSGFQLGGAQPRKLELLRSAQIDSNFLGSTAPRMPRSEAFDHLGVEPGSLIDGDDFTSWCSPPQFRENVTPVCIRIDLPLERELSRIVLKKRTVMTPRSRYGWTVQPDAVEIGRGIAGHLRIELSRDALNWDVVYDGDSGDTPDRNEFEFLFTPRPAKQIRITGTDLPRVEILLHCFSIARVCIYDISGREVSLASFGTTVSAPCFHTFQQPRELHRWYWPLQSELGFKWARIGYHDDPFNWHWVEREKGILCIDPEAEAAIDWLAENKIDLIFNLGFGNRLYTDTPQRNMPLLAEWNFDMPRPPRSQEALAAWERYVEFIVRRFAGRVKIFEIWNEWNIKDYWGEEPDYEFYCELFRRTAPIVRRFAPDSLLMLGSFCGFPFGIASWDDSCAQQEWSARLPLRALAELGPLVDVVGWHPFYNTNPESAEYSGFVDDMRALQSEAIRRGCNVIHTLSEFSWFAPYPEPLGDVFGGGFRDTEVQKAKILACMALRCSALNVPILYCETWNTNFFNDLSLMRRVLTDGVLNEALPEPAFYVMRNLSTILNGFTPADFAALAQDNASGCERAALKNGRRVMLAVWPEGCPQDRSDTRKYELSLKFDAESACAVNPINGEVCELRLENSRTISGLLMYDYPVPVIVTALD